MHILFYKKMLFCLSLKALKIEKYYETADVAQLPAKLAGRMRKNYFVQGQLEQPRKGKNLLYRHDEPNEQTKEGPLT
jgi:hypothetical protein